MKLTIELPDELHRRVAARAAEEGRTLRDMTENLYRAWLGEAVGGPGAVRSGSGLERWLTEARQLVERAGVAGPTASELLEEGRRRLTLP